MIPIPACRVALAPGDGRITRLVAENTAVFAGDVVGVLETPRGARDIVAPGAGVIGGSLVRTSQHVATGEAVLWLARR